MKNILFGLLAMLLFSNYTFAQLMSNEDHRTMMNNYAVNLNSVLDANRPSYLTIDQYKKGIVKGTYTLTSTAKTSITSAAAPLLDYGDDFAVAKGLNATTDALKYFYSTFAPSTPVQAGKLVESASITELKATDMWTCALETFGTDNCGSSALVSDKYNLNTLGSTSVSKLTAVPGVGNIGVLVMLDGFSHCQTIAPLSSITSNADYIALVNADVNQYNQITDFIELDRITRIPQGQWTAGDYESFSQSLGFINMDALNSYITIRQARILNLKRIYDFTTIDPGLLAELNYDFWIKNHTNTGSPSNQLSAEMTPYQEYLLQYKRCKRDYAWGLAASWASAPFTEGVGTLIGVTYSYITFSNCCDDALEDYKRKIGKL